MMEKLFKVGILGCILFLIIKVFKLERRFKYDTKMYLEDYLFLDNQVDHLYNRVEMVEDHENSLDEMIDKIWDGEQENWTKLDELDNELHELKERT